MELGSLHLSTDFSCPKTLRTTSSLHRLTTVKFRPPSSHRYHHRRFVITSSASVPNISSTSTGVAVHNLNNSTVNVNSSCNTSSLSTIYDHQKKISTVDDAGGVDYVPEFEFSVNHGAFGSDVVDSWKWKLTSLLHSNDKQELVLKEKKDRRDYDQIASLASELGLYSRLYAKVVVVSKVPLPNYRFELDDKRPQREVILSPGLHRRVDDHLEKYLSQKPKSIDGSQDNMFPTEIVNNNIANTGPFEQKESLPKNKAVSDDTLFRRSMQLSMEQQAWQKSSEGQKMLEFRRSLPAYKEKDAILNSISKNQVVIISGETGCGKTTQVPQFILESEINSMRGATCSIICTQPRRISAMSVSERIAIERGEKLGENVGYKVRLEGMKGKNTRLLFCTSGVLLRRLLVDRDLKGVTHVIMDEVHERGIDEDFLLTVMKELLPCRPELRLVLMSATINAEIFSSYFNGAPVIQIPGITHPVRTYFLENILESTGYRLTADNQIDDYGQVWKLNKQTSNKRKSHIASSVEEALGSADYSEYSQQTQDSLLCWNPNCINFNLIEYLLCNICENGKPGGILVFMTGWDDIISLKEKLQAHSVLGDPNRVLLLTCHGSMSSSEQRLIFEKVDDGVRKIVLATNIAETSITIDDLVFVIDCGKAKEASYDALNNTPCLLPSWISKVSAKQRRGRSGRVQPGECYHLYPQCVYDSFADFQLPKILRTPLQSLCLQIKSLNLGSISGFLSRALQSPDSLAVQNAVEYLKLIGALDEKENLTILGGYLAMLPMEPKHGKMLVMGAFLNCLDPILTIVAGLTVRDPFLAPLEIKELAQAAKAQFSHGFSDHLALVRAYNGWKVAERKRIGHKYCWKNFLSPQSMKAIDSLRREFQSVLKSIRLIDNKASSYNTYSYDENLVRAVICSGLYPGVCSVVHKDNSLSLKTMEDGQVSLHSKSVNARDFKIPYPWLVFNKKVKVNSVYLQDSTAVSDSTLLLFGGSISIGDVQEGHMKMLGGYFEFFMEPAIAITYRTLKRELDELFQTKLMNPKMNLQAHHELLSAIQLLLSGDQCSGRFVYNHQVIRSNSVPSIASPPLPPPLVSATESGPGGDNSKSQLQTLLARAGYSTPIYKTNLSNNQFMAVCEFNGVQIMGRPCNNKKQAEKDAASKALDWLLGGNVVTRETIDIISMVLKKSKSNQN
ncbi:DExH-box ATP-dependent RNA helicase DExH5, mitochondrial isoform X1 [Helianthus annuus]|uniref:DExH-box ATP-dependent RNA helicase DExH5, mitochondrial isoform X1 n=1 Tax=Helianthus annuus TaxID=4232 RepID=UPI000B8F99F0|nr:DExH-box ATP-dependent RNA helicase DExH5, mitochondrial isoform X1 [Helianthus annuus]